MTHLAEVLGQCVRVGREQLLQLRERDLWTNPTRVGQRDAIESGYSTRARTVRWEAVAARARERDLDHHTSLKTRGGKVDQQGRLKRVVF